MKNYYVNTENRKSKISREIYGHFSEHLGRCIYEGIYVGENSSIPNTMGIRNDVIEALRKIRIPVLRWPGGCFADEYHWKDGIGSKQNRKRMVNTNWGGAVEDNSFGTHEFMELCRLLDCEPYINGNVGSGTVAEMQEWVEYLTFGGISPMSELRTKNGQEKPWKVKFFGVGNESWGCGGCMTGEQYALEYRRYQTFVKNFSGNTVYKIACGSGGADSEWTETLMKVAGSFMNGLSLHHYSLPTGKWADKGSATEFDDEQYYNTIFECLKMEEYVTKHSEIMNKYDPEKKVGLIVDEWGGWYNVEPGTNPGFLYQQNTMRDAIIAGINLNIFNKHSDRVTMANIAQTVNVLQAVILTEGENMLLTPTYHVFDLYKGHQNATLLESFIDSDIIEVVGKKIPKIHESASIDENGNITVTLCNVSVTQAEQIRLNLLGTNIEGIMARIVQGGKNAHNTFENLDEITVSDFDGYKIEGNDVVIDLPACSVLLIELN